MKKRGMKAQNNNHFVQLFEDFPELTNTKVGGALSVHENTVSSWRSGRRECPLWTVALVEKFRQEYAEGKESAKAERLNKNVVLQKEAVPEQTPAMCVICVPRSKLDKLKAVLQLFGYSILDSE